VESPRDYGADGLADATVEPFRNRRFDTQL